MKQKMLVIAIIFLSIGYSSLNAAMYVEGLSKIAFNENDFNVYFSGVYLDEIDYTNEVLNTNKNIITYAASRLKTLGNNHGISYDIANSSSLYDEIVSVTCTSNKSEVTIPTSNTNIYLKAKEVKTGGLALNIDKTVTEDAIITCILETNPYERTKAEIKRDFEYLNKNK